MKTLHILFLADEYARAYGEQGIPTGELYRSITHSRCEKARKALSDAVAELAAPVMAERQEPVTVVEYVGDGKANEGMLLVNLPVGTKLYAAPVDQQAEIERLKQEHVQRLRRIEKEVDVVLAERDVLKAENERLTRSCEFLMKEKHNVIASEKEVFKHAQDLQAENEKLKEYKQWYEEAMNASNEVGFVGMSAEQTIREQAAENERLVDVLRKSLLAMEMAVQFRKTGIGRPPEQTCLLEIDAAKAALENK